MFQWDFDSFKKKKRKKSSCEVFTCGDVNGIVDILAKEMTGRTRLCIEGALLPSPLLLIILIIASCLYVTLWICFCPLLQYSPLLDKPNQSKLSSKFLMSCTGPPEAKFIRFSEKQLNDCFNWPAILWLLRGN